MKSILIWIEIIKELYNGCTTLTSSNIILYLYFYLQLYYYYFTNIDVICIFNYYFFVRTKTWRYIVIYCCNRCFLEKSSKNLRFQKDISALIWPSWPWKIYYAFVYYHERLSTLEIFVSIIWNSWIQLCFKNWSMWYQLFRHIFSWILIIICLSNFQRILILWLFHYDCYFGIHNFLIIKSCLLITYQLIWQLIIRILIIIITHLFLV